MGCVSFRVASPARVALLFNTHLPPGKSCCGSSSPWVFLTSNFWWYHLPTVFLQDLELAFCCFWSFGYFSMPCLAFHLFITSNYFLILSSLSLKHKSVFFFSLIYLFLIPDEQIRVLRQSESWDWMWLPRSVNLCYVQTQLQVEKFLVLNRCSGASHLNQ